MKNPTYDKQVPNIPRFYFNYGLEYHTEGLLGKHEISRIYIDASYVHDFDWSWQMSNLPEQRKKWLIPRSSRWGRRERTASTSKISISIIRV